MNLFREGYSVVATPVPGAFRVQRPASRGGGFYVVNAARDTCNCAAYKRGQASGVGGQKPRCRHRIGLRSLVMETAKACEDAGEYQRAARLLDAWARTLLLMEAIRMVMEERAA